MKIYIISIVTFIFAINSCFQFYDSRDPFEVGGNLNSAKIILIGEEHGVGWILDKQFETWHHYYVNEGLRHLFIEVGYFTAQYYNLWMRSDNDDIFDILFEDLKGSPAYNTVNYEFYKRLKRECPETIFHGTDVGHQYWSTGERFLNYLQEIGLQDTEQYNLTLEAIEQGKYFYDNNANEYRENMMAQNFIREFDNIGNTKIIGFYGSSHTNFNKNGFYGRYPNMANQLRSHYGDIIYFENYRYSRW